jgi:hypothetical protein
LSTTPVASRNLACKFFAGIPAYMSRGKRLFGPKSRPHGDTLGLGEHKMKSITKTAVIRLAKLGSFSSTGPGKGATARAAGLLIVPFLEFRAQPWLDRGIAFIAMLPFLYLTYYRYQHMRLGIPLASFAIGTSITFLTMILRRPPKRVTPNPLYRLLTFVVGKENAESRHYRVWEVDTSGFLWQMWSCGRFNA